jgi:hypothetical protein
MLGHRTGRFTILTNELLENGLNMIATIRPARLEDAPGIGKVQIDSWRSSYKGLVDDAFLATLSSERRPQVWSQLMVACLPGCFDTSPAAPSLR